ncbi:PEP-CTERM sorting domain-containing protein [bacterium]|nr:MAG: PEP-CTERM sorting domain-containing protein [bacterium]
MVSKFLSVLSLGALALTSAQAAFIYGISTGSSSGIFKIDTATGASTKLYSVANIGALNNNVTNSLAYDAATGDFYFNGADKKLYKRNASGEFLVGTLSKSAASGTFYNGSFYYVENSTKNIHKVDVNTFSDSVFSSPSALTGASYGDVASDDAGNIYGAASNGVWKSSLTAPSQASFLTTSATSLQLGFYGSSLFGINASNDRIYSVNLTNGAITNTATLVDAAGLFITDAASAQAVPEPASMIALGLGAAAMIRRRRKA